MDNGKIVYKSAMFLLFLLFVNCSSTPGVEFKNYTDKAGKYAVDLPKDWEIEFDESYITCEKNKEIYQGLLLSLDFSHFEKEYELTKEALERITASVGNGVTTQNFKKYKLNEYMVYSYEITGVDVEADYFISRRHLVQNKDTGEEVELDTRVSKKAFNENEEAIIQKVLHSIRILK